MLSKRMSLMLFFIAPLQTAIAETNMKNFDIKTLKLGMTIEEGKNSIREKCIKKLYQGTDNGIPSISCSTGRDKKDYVEFKAKNRIFTIIDGQKINLEKGNSNINLKKNLIDKMTEKYGKPNVFFTGNVNLGFTDKRIYEQLVVEEALCWGDCQKMYDTRSGKQILDVGEKAFVVTFTDAANGGRDGALPAFGFNGKKGKSLLVKRYLIDNQIKTEALKSVRNEEKAKQKKQAEETKKEAEKLADQVEL